MKRSALFDAFLPPNAILRYEAFSQCLSTLLALNITGIPETSRLTSSTIQARSLLRDIWAVGLLRRVGAGRRPDLHDIATIETLQLAK